MNIESILQLAAQVFQSKLGADQQQNLNVSSLIPALTGLLSNSEGKLDLSSLISNMDSKGLMSLAQSWLGDGQNDAVSGQQITQMFGQDKISDFSQRIGLDQGDAVGGLQEAIPTLIDKASSGGSLLEQAGGLSGLMGMAKSLFGR